MLDHRMTQIESPALGNSRFIFDEVLFMNINSHQLNLTRGSSYLPLPGRLANKKAITNPENENDEECFKWAVIAALHPMRKLGLILREFQTSEGLKIITIGVD